MYAVLLGLWGASGDAACDWMLLHFVVPQLLSKVPCCRPLVHAVEYNRFCSRLRHSIQLHALSHFPVSPSQVSLKDCFIHRRQKICSVSDQDHGQTGDCELHG